MKNHSNILKFLIFFAVSFVVWVVLEKLFGNAAEGSIWHYFIQSGAILLAYWLADVADKNDWTTWSGLIKKFKKDK